MGGIGSHRNAINARLTAILNAILIIIVKDSTTDGISCTTGFLGGKRTPRPKRNKENSQEQQEYIQARKQPSVFLSVEPVLHMSSHALSTSTNISRRWCGRETKRTSTLRQAPLLKIWL